MSNGAKFWKRKTLLDFFPSLSRKTNRKNSNFVLGAGGGTIFDATETEIALDPPSEAG
jgi:hypothetical protein